MCAEHVNSSGARSYLPENWPGCKPCLMELTPTDGLTAVERRKSVNADHAMIRLFIAYPDFINYMPKKYRGGR